MIGLRRRHPYIRFDKEISTKAKNDIFVLSHLARSGGAVHPKELSEEFMISTAQMAVILWLRWVWAYSLRWPYSAY